MYPASPCNALLVLYTLGRGGTLPPKEVQRKLGAQVIVTRPGQQSRAEGFFCIIIILTITILIIKIIIMIIIIIIAITLINNI